jgi:hypothetical protein
MDRRRFAVSGLCLLAAPGISPSLGRALTSLARRSEASEDECPGAIDWESARLWTLCISVSEKVPDEDPSSPFDYAYQEKLFRVANADPRRDTPGTAARKIQHMWVVLGDRLVCDSLGFNVANGSIIKLAVGKRFDDFITDVVEWGVPLNRIDPSDERTVLDYAQFEREKAAGDPLEDRMARYYTKLRGAGARHRAEIERGEAAPFVDPYGVEIAPLLRRYDRACYYSEGLAAVKKGKLWGYADRESVLRIPHTYDGAFNFSESRAAVVKDGKWGYVDPTGAVPIPLRYRGARVFEDGRAMVTLDGVSWTAIGPNGQPAG